MVEKLHSPALERHGRPEQPGRKGCEWPDCTAEGEHRAPRSRDELNDYRWFCRDHAREYNKRWNYFAGMTDDEVEADRRADTVWRRPSWPLGDGPPTPEQARMFARGEFADPFKVFGDTPNDGRKAENAVDHSFDGEMKKALAIFDLRPPVSREEVKSRYKALVKRHHPDTADGNADEERIKDINQAYQVIIAFLSA